MRVGTLGATSEHGAWPGEPRRWPGVRGANTLAAEGGHAGLAPTSRPSMWLPRGAS